MLNVKNFIEQQAAKNEMLEADAALAQQKTYALFSDDEAAKVLECQAKFDAAKAKFEALSK